MKPATVLKLSRAWEGLRAALLSASAAMQRLADAINENTNRAKLRALYGSYKRMAKGQNRRRRYYHPGENPQPANPVKGIGKPRKAEKFDTPGNNDRIREARESQAAKAARRAARHRRTEGGE